MVDVPAAMSPAARKAIDLAKSLRDDGLRGDPYSLDYEDVRCFMNAKELYDIAGGITVNEESLVAAQMMILELLHVLASPNPHAELVREKLAEETNIFERARDFLGIDLEIGYKGLAPEEGHFGAANG